MEPTQQQNPQPPAPVIQLQLPGIPSVPQRASNVQLLIEVNKEYVNQGNKSEEKVALQIILTASAILAIISGVGITNTTSKYSMPAAVLLILAIVSLGVAVAAGVIHFITERHFWYSNWKKTSDALNTIAPIPDEQSREAAAYSALANTRQGSNRAAFTIMVITFLTGTVSLLIIIVAAIVNQTT